MLCFSVALVHESLADPITSARVSTQQSDQIVVDFDRPVRVSNAAGFRLIGGAARIERLVSGSGTQQLKFQLTDHVLPDDQFTLVYWGGLGDAVVGKTSLTDTDPIKVTNSVGKYNGSGTLYYVSSKSGNDQNDGRSPQKPLRSIDRAQDKVKPGDYVLLKRGEQWNTRLIVRKSGSKGKYITFAAYDKGSKPIIMSAFNGIDKVRGIEITMATITVRAVDYIQIDNIHVKTSGVGSSRTKDDGIQIGNGSKYAVVSNCVAQGIGSHGNWGIRVTVGRLPNTTYPQVLNSEVYNYYANLGTQLYPYDGKHGIEKGGLIENCISRDPIQPNNIIKAPWENLMLNRGNFNGFVIRKNKVYNYPINGIETYGSKNVIVEYNEVYGPLNYNAGGRAIKAGGYNTSGQTASGVGELYSENIIVRYNKVHDITRGNTNHVNGIDANNSKSGEIYGNLIYNVRNHGIKIPSKINGQGWRVHHNTVLNCGEDAIHVYASGPNAADVTIYNNIAQGNKFDINCLVNGTSKRIAGKNNILLNNKAAGEYQGEGDMKASLNELFVNPSKRDYRLVKGSPAINSGTAISDYRRDQTGVAISGRPDIGAFEYPGETASPPAASLSVNAGSDVTITLPTNRASFQAQASGTNGTSVSYRWTKKSGPSATLNNTTSSKLDLQNAQVGTYVLAVTASANGKSASDELRLIVKPAKDNNPPNPSPSPPVSNKNGLHYKYYEGSWISLPDFATQKVLKQGTVANFDPGVRQRGDLFGIVYTGSIQIFTSGSYTFYTISDDGSKLYINGKQVVDNGGLHGPRERSGKVTLSKGRHRIEVRFFERTGGEKLEVHYAGPGISKQRIPNGVLYPDESTTPSPEPDTNPPTSSSNGLRYEYYEGAWSSLPNFGSQTVRKQGVVSNFDLGVRQRSDNFGVVFTGSIDIKSNGGYTFYTKSDDGSKLYIDGKQVVNNDNLHGPRENSGKITLSAGRHSIEVQFFERTGGEMLEVRYAGPGISKQRIPSGVLYLDGNTPPDNPKPEPEPKPDPAPKPNPVPPTSPTAKNGLRYRYYEGSWGLLPNFGSLPIIKQGTVPNVTLGVRQRDDRFGLVFTGKIQINTSGTYTFYTTSDNGSKLFINGKEVVDNDGKHPPQERSGKLSLSKGYHTIEVQFFELTVGEMLEMRYAGPGISKQKIPNGVLFLDVPNNARTATSDTEKLGPNLRADNDQPLDMAQINIYPVPFEDQLTIDFGGALPEQAVRISLIDYLGKVIIEQSVAPNQGKNVIFNLRNLGLSKGMYHVNVVTEGELPRSFKVIKQ